MVPPEAFSTAAPQSSIAFCSGCEAGTQCEIFNSKVFSCANAGVTLAASSSAKNVFLIDIVSLSDCSLLFFLYFSACPCSDGLFSRALQTLLYDIIIIASLRQSAGRRGGSSVQ